ncbi:MAG TPA: GNAT family N-acetyltransferase [Cerasibacillus sp.]|uniref:GNAT family N-acetyltransferase n=1 Tax=Cerasibacillus sp. TaxID=2498711 RepID=UPI002F409328
MYKPYDRSQLQNVINLIVGCNNSESYQVGFVGDGYEEVRETLLYDFSDLPLEESIYTYEEDDVFTCFAFDISTRDKYVEVWGPFLDKHIGLDKVYNLWVYAMEHLHPLKLNYNFFIGAHNQLAINFLEDYVKADRIRQHDNLEFKISNRSFSNIRLPNNVQVIKVETLSQNYYTALVNLHHRYFPGTYYSIDDILERINRENNLYLLIKNHQLAGYAYLEKSTTDKHVSLEYIAIDGAFQGQGLSKLLFASIVKETEQDEFSHIQLCVDENNQRALNLYESLGFFLASSYIHYKL